MIVYNKLNVFHEFSYYNSNFIENKGTAYIMLSC